FAAGDFDESLRRAQHCDFDKAALRQAGVPRRLEAVCLRAMAAEPEGRYATADDLARDLEAFAHGTAWWPWLLAVVSIVAIGIGLLGWSKGWWSSRVTLPPLKPLTVKVMRDGQWYPEVTGVVPLQSGDEVRMSADVPPGLHVGLFLVDGEGRLSQLTQ